MARAMARASCEQIEHVEHHILRAEVLFNRAERAHRRAAEFDRVEHARAVAGPTAVVAEHEPPSRRSIAHQTEPVARLSIPRLRVRP